MQPPSSGLGLRQKAAIGAVETMGKTLRVLTLTELMRLMRDLHVHCRKSDRPGLLTASALVSSTDSGHAEQHRLIDLPRTYPVSTHEAE
jgi:hypothetical protein